MPAKTRTICITVNGNIDPSQRHRRFEQPILDALLPADPSADITGGGTFFGPAAIEGCDIDLETIDLEAALAAVRKVMAAEGLVEDTEDGFSVDVYQDELEVN